MNGTNELREWYGDYINVEDQDYHAVTADIFLILLKGRRFGDPFPKGKLSFWPLSEIRDRVSLTSAKQQPAEPSRFTSDLAVVDPGEN
jgi:hypothetical protein